jgi:hypothetical protein
MSLTFDPTDPRLKPYTRAVTGTEPQDEVYLVLTEEERAKGFVRPLRTSYIHVGVAGPVNPLRDLTGEEHQRYDKFGYVKYEDYPKGESSILGRFWTQRDVDGINNGCKVVTKMAMPLAETYARDPKFYGATYCCGCGKHIPVAEFVWDGTNEEVGS